MWPNSRTAVASLAWSDDVTMAFDPSHIVNDLSHYPLEYRVPIDVFGSPIEVVSIDRVVRVYVVVRVATEFGVDAEEPPEHGAVGTGAHFDDRQDSAFMFGPALSGPAVVEVAVAVVGDAVEGVAEWVVGLGGALFGAGGVGGGGDVGVEVGVGPDVTGGAFGEEDAAGEGEGAFDDVVVGVEGCAGGVVLGRGGATDRVGASEGEGEVVAGG